jgi:hypothetical protein
MKLRDQAKSRVVPEPRLTGPPSSGYNTDEDYL